VGVDSWEQSNDMISWDKVFFFENISFEFLSKKANKWIGAFVFKIIELFIALLTWP
jgi:hypothetical protein